MNTEPIADETAERSVLGSMMLSPACIPDVVARLRPSDFHVYFHESIYRTILAMSEQGEAVDATTVLARMDTGDLARGGGAPALFDIISTTPTAANVRYYIDIVEDKAQRRGMQAAALRITQLAESTEGEAGEILETARAELETVVRGNTGLSLLYDDFLEFKPTFGIPEEGTIPSPWGSLDRMINGGFVPGRVYIVASRPGVGKSITAAQFALAIGTVGACGLSSLEMTRRELVMRMTANLANVPLNALQGVSEMTPTFHRRLNLVDEQMQSFRTYIDDRASVTPTMVGSFARTMDRRNGPLRGLIVDYLQLMSLGRKVESRQGEVSAMSRAMKLLAKEMNIPVIVLAQLNRDVEHRHSKIPTLADLRESGSLEQDADVVIFLSMEMEEDPVSGEDVESMYKTRLSVAKNRHGEKGYILLDREGEYSRLIEPPVY